MYKEKVIVTVLPIIRAGQVVNFQVKIPHDALRIIGIERSARYTVSMIPKAVGTLPSTPNTASSQATNYTTTTQKSTGTASTVASDATPKTTITPNQNAVTDHPVMMRKRMVFNIVSPSIKFSQNTLLGDIRLQSCEDTNIFYSDDVYYDDVNASYGDYSSTELQPSTPTHGLKREECTVHTIGKTTILKGIYRDRQTNPSDPDWNFISYEARLYVWYEKKIDAA